MTGTGISFQIFDGHPDEEINQYRIDKKLNLVNNLAKQKIN